MNELSEKYHCEIDFFYFDIEQDASAEALKAVNMHTRSTYALLSPDGSEVARWFGPLEQDDLVAQIVPLIHTSEN